MKKILISILALTLVLGGCASEETSSSTAVTEESSSPDTVESATPQSDEAWADGYLPQFQKPESGTPIVTLSTTMGEIEIMLFPDGAPLAVENFVTHAENGYYDGVIFHRILNDFMIQGGDPTGTGMGGESIWDGTFKDETNDNLYNFRGALSMANAGPSTNGAQFFFVQSDTADVAEGQVGITEEFKQLQMDSWKNQKIATAYLNEFAEELQKGEKNEEEIVKYSAELQLEMETELALELSEQDKVNYTSAIEKYNEVGGTPHLDFKHTVFGQVIEGMDVVDAIAAVAVNADGRPAEEVIINSATVEYAE